MKHIVFSLGFLLLGLAVPPFAAALPVAVTISSATIASSQITVGGTGFCPVGIKPSVVLNTTILTVTSTCNNTKLTAKLPTISAGSYILKVTNSE